MTVLDREILGAAHKIAGTADCEADYRAAIGRAYYSAYHHSRGFHSALPAPGSEPPPETGGVHAQIIHRLTHPTVIDPAIKTSSRQMGYMLKTMKFERRRADYELEDTISADDAKHNIALAERLFAIG